MKDQITESRSISKTHKLATEVLKNLADVNVLCLYGELGAGKTTFVQGLAQALGVKHRIISPTFILIREYGLNFQTDLLSLKKLIHLDFYRIDSAKDIKSFSLKELIIDKNNLVVIEWADKIKTLLPEKRIDINFEHSGKNKRKIKIAFKNREDKK
jgi:tRNA threonylcarbamoyladenosine biosynthesis protein TsaE